MKKPTEYIALTVKILYLALFLFLCGWFLISQIFLPKETNPRDYYSATFNENWFLISDNGEKIPFAIPGTCDVADNDTAVFEKLLPDELPSHMWLCFRTSKQDMNIYIDGLLRESFSTLTTRPFGVSSASAYIFVPLEPTDSGKTLRVSICSDSTYNGVMRTVLYGDKLGIAHRLFSENLPTLIPTVFMLFLGLCSVAVSRFFEYRLKTKIHLTYLAWCIIAASIWIITQSKIRQAFFPNVSVTSAFSTFILFLIPIPFAIYMNNMQNRRYHLLYLVLEIATFANFIITASIIVTNTMDQSEVYLGIYILFALLITVSLLTVWWDIKKKFIRSYIFVAYGILGVIISAVAQIIVSFNRTQMFNGGIFCYGLLFLQLTAALQTAADIMQEERIKQQDLDASRAKTAFLAGMSHELRTPINAVLGITEMIAEETAENNIREYAGDIQTAGRSLLATVNDILDFSKIESGKMQLVPLEYDLAALIHDSCSIVKGQADHKDLAFEIQCNEKLPCRLLGDEVRIRQILINLLTNAIKYTNTGTVTLKVSGKKISDSSIILCFAVKDTGIGIPQEAIPLLFDSFNRVDDTATHKIEGTGLGLSIVHTLVTLMSGSIRVKSRYGKGSVFTVMLPQEIVSNAPIGHLSDNWQHTATEKENTLFAPDARILLVDDVSMNLKVFCGLLKNTLIHIDTASSGMECLEKLRRHSYDLLFLDHMMPEMDGIETLQQLRQLPNGSPEKLPVIMLTANAVLGAKEDYLQRGFDDYLSKPIQKSRLIKILKQYLPEELILSSSEFKISYGTKGIENITFLNTRLGLSYYSGDKDFYLEIIQSFLESDCRNTLEEFFQSSDWTNYQILIHSLKSTSKSIGAEQLSSMARELENALKENNTAYVLTHHGDIMTVYGELLDNISTLFIKSPDSANQTVVPEEFEILVVDDDKTNLKTARTILGKYFRVSCAESGPAAIARITEAPPDMILLDIHMPGMNGFEVLAHLKHNNDTCNIPVVFLTADTDTETELSSFKAGAMDFIHKPFVPDIMLERINRIIHSNQLQHHLQSEVKKKTSEVEMLSLQAMMTLAQTIDAKDPYTKGHSMRVAKYSKKLAKKLGLSATEQDNVYFMGLLHDIGKIGVPDYIINKPQKLTDEEFAVVKKHPETGYDILKHFKEIPHIEQGARWHHERLDGTGYPDRLTGEQIPLLVRLISVADSYDAMTSRRSYRNVLPMDYILQELEKGKGTQFDPNVAEAMIQLIKEEGQLLQ